MDCFGCLEVARDWEYGPSRLSGYNIELNSAHFDQTELLNVSRQTGSSVRRYAGPYFGIRQGQRRQVLLRLRTLRPPSTTRLSEQRLLVLHRPTKTSTRVDQAQLRGLVPRLGEVCLLEFTSLAELFESDYQTYHRTWRWSSRVSWLAPS